ncbi:hypothetical protein [Thermincola potens]|nr:hypothetical protein [Thermincola potens]
MKKEKKTYNSGANGQKPKPYRLEYKETFVEPVGAGKPKKK